jgi:pyruvate-formate lyase-activating enzyme
MTIETNGFLGEKLADAELETIDHVMLGIKSWDPERHRELSGRDIGPTLAFARQLAAAKRPIGGRRSTSSIRFPAHPAIAKLTRLVRYPAVARRAPA